MGLASERRPGCEKKVGGPQEGPRVARVRSCGVVLWCLPALRARWVL